MMNVVKRLFSTIFGTGEGEEIEEFDVSLERHLIVGLGNPGKKYDYTRHNIGFTCVNALAEKYNLQFDTKKHKAVLADGTIGGKRVLLAKPQTYMNLSGEAVRGIVDFFKIPVENILVVSDDLDVPLGTLRLRPKGGAGGQKGVRSIIQHLGTQEFARLRFGIDRPPGKMDAAAYVLMPFADAEVPLAEETIDRAVQAMETWLQAGIQSAMNQHNGTIEDVMERQRKQNPDSKEAEEEPTTTPPDLS